MPAPVQPPISQPRIEWRDARLHRHADYQRAYQASRKQFSASMSWFFSPRQERSQELSQEQNPLGPARVGLTVGKVIGKAHERNRIKRRMRAAIRNHLASLPAGVDLILHPKRVVLTIDFSQLNAEVHSIFARAAEQALNPATPAARKPYAVVPTQTPAVRQRSASPSEGRAALPSPSQKPGRTS